MITSTLRFAIALVLVAPWSYAFEDEPTNLSPDAIQFFETKIRPVLAEKCYRCHSSDGQGVRGGLSVDNRDALLAGGESGPAVVPALSDIAIDGRFCPR